MDDVGTQPEDSFCVNCGARTKLGGQWCQRRECLAAKSKAWYYAHTAGKKPNPCSKCGKPLEKRNATYRMHIECRTSADRVSTSCLGCGASIRADMPGKQMYCCVKCLGLARKLGKLIRSLEGNSNGPVLRDPCLDHVHTVRRVCA